MISLCYVSRATERLTQEQLVSLLEHCHRNNHTHKVTGLLLYNGFGTFIQVIEGYRHSIGTLYRNIRNDNRHERVNLLWCTEIKNRDFPNWKMGFRNLDDAGEVTIEGFSDFMQQNNQVSYLQTNRNFAMALLAHFKKETDQLVSASQWKSLD